MKKTLKNFDLSSLPPIEPYDADSVRSLRLRDQLGEAAFARYLGVTERLVRRWENALNLPYGPSLKMLNLVERKGVDWVAGY